MRRTTILRSAALCAVAALVLTACGGGSSSSSGSSASEGGFKVPNLTALDKLGTPEGEVSVLAWPGYVEDGSNDPKVDWVSDFEKESGCKVTVKTFGTSDEAVQLFRTGQYDTVSASGDATLRLIASGDVEPVNTDLISNYPDIFDSPEDAAVELGPRRALRHPPRPRREPAHVAHRPGEAGSRQLVGRVRPGERPEGQGHGVRLAHLHRRRGAVPHDDQARPWDQEPLRPRRRSSWLRLSTLLKAQKANVGEYWSDYLKEIQAFKNGPSTVGTTWQVIANLAQAEKAPVQVVLPKEGATGWSDTWMVGAKSQHKTCAYKFIDHIVSPKTNAASRRVLR